MTKQRALILEIIRSDKCHHTAEEIFRLAKAKLSGISLATVYNNLKALESDGLIRKITGDGSSDRYDSSYLPHGHLVCQKCDRMWDFNIEGFDELLSETLGGEFSSYELKVRCLCDSCRAGASASGQD